MQIEKKIFGQDDNGIVYKYLIENNGFKVELCECGASILSIVMKDGYGSERDVVLGLEGLEAYKRNWPAFGSVIGRYANRIKKASFKIDDKKYNLKKNIIGGCIHSGYGYHYRKWSSSYYEDSDNVYVIFELFSEDGDQGFPGNLQVKVEYIVTNNNTLSINYYYISDKKTPVNLTNHCYFNLEGYESGSVLEHYLMIDSKAVTQFDKNLMPTGKILDIEGSAFDFNKKKQIKENLDKTFKPYCYDKEYDINYVLNKELEEFSLVANLESYVSKIGMNVYTNMPGMQFYTANAIGGMKGKNGVVYEKNPAVCFETQFYPDAVNVKEFPSPFIEANIEVHKRTDYEFYIIN
ncbi:MAG: galactose mutarotase [Lachnospiraceae bacterium]|nr:galactose mutarotase [Lachnospiraceae bacterium]